MPNTQNPKTLQQSIDPANFRRDIMAAIDRASDTVSKHGQASFSENFIQRREALRACCIQPSGLQLWVNLDRALLERSLDWIPLTQTRLLLQAVRAELARYPYALLFQYEQTQKRVLEIQNSQLQEENKALRQQLSTSQTQHREQQTQYANLQQHYETVYTERETLKNLFTASPDATHQAWLAAQTEIAQLKYINQSLEKQNQELQALADSALKTRDEALAKQTRQDKINAFVLAALEKQGLDISEFLQTEAHSSPDASDASIAQANTPQASTDAAPRSVGLSSSTFFQPVPVSSSVKQANLASTPGQEHIELSEAYRLPHPSTHSINTEAVAPDAQTTRVKVAQKIQQRCANTG